MSGKVRFGGSVAVEGGCGVQGKDVEDRISYDLMYVDKAWNDSNTANEVYLCIRL